MSPTHCIWELCFIPLPKDGQKFFGFAEFLAALALMVLAWTIADVRYRFRVRTAPIPLQRITFWVVAAIGILTLLTDLWRAGGWLVPRGGLLTPALWQAILGSMVFLTFIAWVWFAFIRPSIFGPWNAKWYGGELYRAILRGAPIELSEIADELGRSAEALVKYSWQSHERPENFPTADSPKQPSRTVVARHNAEAILHLIADRQFCKHIVGTASSTIQAFVDEVARQKRYRIPLGVFAKNITTEAIANRDSFIYREVSGYYTGYLGHHKPLTKALYGNYSLVDSLDKVFDVDYRERGKWTPEQWEAFCRIVLMTFKSYVESGYTWNHSTVLFRAFGDIEDSVGDLQNLKESDPDWWKRDSVRNLKTVVRFATDAAEILDSHKGDEVPVKLRRKPEDFQMDVYDLVAKLMYEMIDRASYVTASKWMCWSIQHNDVWSDFFGRLGHEGKASKIIRHKLRRLIYADIKRMSNFPNFQGARILGLVLNISGLGVDSNSRSSIALQKAAINWTKRHYATMAQASPKVAQACLVEGITYDVKAAQLVRTGMEFLDREPNRNVLVLDPPQGTISPRVGQLRGPRRRKLPRARLFG